MAITNSHYKAAAMNTALSGTYNSSTLTEIADNLEKVVRRDLQAEALDPTTPLVVTTNKSVSTGGITRMEVVFDKTYALINSVTGESVPIRGIARLQLSNDNRLTLQQKRDVVGALISWLLFSETIESGSSTSRVIDRLCMGEF